MFIGRPQRYPCPAGQPSSCSMSCCAARLDAFCDRVDAEVAAQSDDARADGAVDGSLGGVDDEGPIDLHPRDGQSAQVGQTAVARAEVIQRNAEAVVG